MTVRVLCVRTGALPQSIDIFDIHCDSAVLNCEKKILRDTRKPRVRAAAGGRMHLRHSPHRSALS